MKNKKMSDQPDKLFRDKLYGYQTPVPSEAWSQVSTNLNQKKKVIWWQSAAAAIAILCVAGIAIYPLTRGNHTEITQPIKNAVPLIDPPLISQLPEAKPEKDKEMQPSAITSPATTDETMAKRKQAPTRKPASPTNIAAVPEELPVIVAPEPRPIADIAPTNPIPADKINEPTIPSDRKRVTIVFTQTEVNEKYLSKTPESHATSSNQEPSRLKNMLEKAYDLTHNQDPIGDLRQKKNEILAMNFRKEKPDTQND